MSKQIKELASVREQPALDEYKAAYIEAMVASNEAGFAGMTAAETIRELNRMVSEQPAPAQEPVAWHEPGSFGNVTTHKKWALENGWIPLYNASPKKKWVGLTNQEIDDLWNQHEPRFDYYSFSCDIEAKLKEKNA